MIPSVDPRVAHAAGPAKRWLTTTHAARRLGLAPGTLRRFAREGRAPALRVVGEWRIDSAWVEKQIAKADAIGDETALVVSGDADEIRSLAAELRGRGFDVR